jgi:hypothetical protein
MAKQKQFEGDEFKRPKDSFGGSLLKNSHAKTQRPLDSKLPIHLTLKAKKSVMRLPKNFKLVNTTVARVCKKHGVTIYKYANVGNHVHLNAVRLVASFSPAHNGQGRILLGSQAFYPNCKGLA